MGSVRRHLLAISLAAGSLPALLLSCGSPKRAPLGLHSPEDDVDVGVVETTPEPTFDAPSDIDFNCSSDAAGVCACKEIGQKPTALYLVLDRSGSMSYIVPPGSLSSWDVVRKALLDSKTGVIRKLGARITIGAARFPGPDATPKNGCPPGAEILSSRAGSTEAYDQLAKILSAELPNGGTPTAATLTKLAPTLKKLPAPAYVLLATDGGPNCGTVPCAIDRCIPNLERETFSGGVCDDKVNCCDPTKPPFGPYTGCLDTDNTKKAVEDLVASGIKVFVLGIPSDKIDLYGKELDALAIAGGVPQEGAATKYYAASDVAGLTTALSAIAAKVVDSCLITLSAPVSDPGITNVLLDGELIPQDPVDGWSWTDDTHSAVRLNGKSCARVTSGEVASVKVAVGCKTITK